MVCEISSYIYFEIYKKTLTYLKQLELSTVQMYSILWLILAG